jgi:SnoaL-like protein
VTIVETFRAFYDTFSAAWLDRLEELYAPDFVVEDPFHVFRGDFAAMRAYFARVLALPHSRFATEDAATGSDGIYVRWRWEYKLFARSRTRELPGVTHLRLRGERIAYHRDLFDASVVYEGLPVLGGALRAAKRLF